MHFKTGYFWSGGPGDGVNQDSLALLQVDHAGGEALMAVVCDGIGSFEGSEDVGAYALTYLSDWFFTEGKKLIRDDDSGQNILAALQKCILKLIKSLEGIMSAAGIKAGTTCSVLLLAGREYFIAHVGDSRIYMATINNPIKKLLSKKSHNLRQLTFDHIDSEGRLKRALGLSEKDRFFFDMGRLRKHSSFLVCSDGLYYGNEDSIGKVLEGAILTEKDNIDRRLEMLAERANSKGNTDNQSGIIIKVV